MEYYIFIEKDDYDDDITKRNGFIYNVNFKSRIKNSIYYRISTK